jgi:hypothetical protein
MLDTTIQIDEALTAQQRMKKRTQMRILAPKIAMAKKRNAKKMATKEKLEDRAKKQAKNMLVMKIAKKPKSEMSFSERERVEARLAKMKTQINTIAKKLFKNVKQHEVERIRGMRNPDQN